MKLIFSLFLAILTSLGASVNEPLRWEYFTGYRNDRIHWHLQNPGGVTSYSELYRNIQFWENGLILKTIHRDIFFFLRGSYSAFGRGELVQFPSNTRGWAADVSGSVSYGVNLTAGRTYQWILLPLLGYSAYFERLHQNQLPFFQQLRQSWYGVFFGVALQIDPGGRLLFHLGYTYHLLRTRFITQWSDQLETPYSLHVNQGGNLGQTGWGQVDYRLSRSWRVGFGAQIHYFSTHFLPVRVNESIPQTFKLRWIPIDGWFQISREF